MATWIEDTNGNRCSVEYWGSHEGARKALDSLKNCSRCSRCSGCSGCSDCSDCSREKGEKGEFKPLQVPVIPDIHRVVYAAASQPKALEMANVHTCENTHCRAGWVITLAGEAGRELEKVYGWNLAAMLIYDQSAPGFKINPCRFYDRNTEALADMKALSDASATAVTTEPDK